MIKVEIAFNTVYESRRFNTTIDEHELPELGGKLDNQLADLYALIDYKLKSFS